MATDYALSDVTWQIFDEDYLYFCEVYLTPERTARDCALIASLCGLPPGASILDVGCGHGRISNTLAQMGFSVTGIDVERSALERARREAKSLGVDVTYLETDFLSVDFRDEFDCVVSWYTSFGLADDECNRRMLAKMCAAARDGGICLIEHINRDRSLSSFQHAMVHERDGNFMIDLIDFDPLTSRSLRTRKICRNGRTRVMRYEIRLFTLAELADWMRMAGFAEVQGYGRDGERFVLGSERMITVATKRGR